LGVCARFIGTASGLFVVQTAEQLGTGTRTLHESDDDQPPAG